MAGAGGRQVYLGDGVTASTDGFHIVLFAGTKEIFLDPSVFAALIRYATAINFPGTEG